MKKMDEMEQSHTLQAIRIVYIYSVIFEFAYWIMECVKAKEILTKSSVVFFLILTQGIVLVFSQLYFKTRVSDPKGKTGIIIAVIFAVFAVILGVFVMQFE